MGTTDQAGKAVSSGGYPRKRMQTRGRLLAAGMRVLAAKGPGGVTAGEIASEAGVAAGTFYNHFHSLDEFIESVAQQLGRGIEIGGETLASIEHDPGARVAIGLLQLLQMADEDPVSASAFVSLSAARPEFRARVRAMVGLAIADGVRAGRFSVDDGPAATNAVLGTALQSMRSRVLGETDHSEAPAVIRLTLAMLGVAPVDIDVIVAQAEASARSAATLD